MDPQRGVLVVDRRRYVVEDHIEEGRQVGSVPVGVQGGRSGPGIGVDDRELDLVLGSAQVEE